MWLLRLILGGLGWLRELLAGLVRWVFSDWRNGPLLVCAAMWAAHMFLIEPRLRDQLAEAEASLAAEVEAHNGTIAEFVEAAHQAERAQTDNLKRVKADQAGITERIEDDYQTRLTALRARADALAGAAAGRVRAGAPQVDPGASGPAGLSGSGAATGSTDEAATASGFPHGLRLICSEIQLQLNSLIDWNLQQADVITTPEPAS